jgi:hypothetical protein
LHACGSPPWIGKRSRKNDAAIKAEGDPVHTWQRPEGCIF